MDEFKKSILIFALKAGILTAAHMIGVSMTEQMPVKILLLADYIVILIDMMFGEGDKDG